MIKSALVIIANGTEELEAVTVIDILRRAEIEVTIAGQTDIIHCAYGLKILPDIPLHKVKENYLYDLVYLPGGSKGIENLSEEDKVFEILALHHQNKKFIAAICAAPLLLESAGLLDNSTAITSHPSVRDYLQKYNYSEERLVEHGHILSSRSAGTALEFSLFIVEKILGSETSDRIRKAILYEK